MKNKDPALLMLGPFVHILISLLLCKTTRLTARKHHSNIQVQYERNVLIFSNLLGNYKSISFTTFVELFRQINFAFSFFNSISMFLNYLIRKLSWWKNSSGRI